MSSPHLTSSGFGSDDVRLKRKRSFRDMGGTSVVRDEYVMHYLPTISLGGSSPPGFPTRQQNSPLSSSIRPTVYVLKLPKTHSSTFLCILSPSSDRPGLTRRRSTMKPLFYTRTGHTRKSSTNYTRSGKPDGSASKNVSWRVSKKDEGEPGKRKMETVF